MEDNAKLITNSNIKNRKMKTKSEKEILKVTTSARKAVQKAENTSVARSIKACESLRDERAMARRKLASVVSESEGKLKRKASEVEVSNLSDKTCQETECATADMNMANIAVTSRHSTQSQSNPWRINWSQQKIVTTILRMNLSWKIKKSKTQMILFR